MTVLLDFVLNLCQAEPQVPTLLGPSEYRVNRDAVSLCGSGSTVQ